MTKPDGKSCWIDAASVVPRLGSAYQPPFASALQGREKRAVGAAVGLGQFGVNLASARCPVLTAAWHENEDEFVYTLVTGAWETLVRPGMAVGFLVGKPDGHYLINRSEKPAFYLEVGTRAPTEVAHYRDIDLAARKEGGCFSFTDENGNPYP
jgi:uncharacterized cupin superfamily protein